MDSGELENAEKIMADIERLDAEFEKQAKAEANLKALTGGGSKMINNLMEGSKLNEEKTYRNAHEMYSSFEYRNAFMRNVLANEKIPVEFTNTAAQSTTGDVGAVIPTTVMDMIVQKIEKYGTILPLVTQTAYKGLQSAQQRIHRNSQRVRLHSHTISLFAKWRYRLRSIK